MAARTIRISIGAGTLDGAAGLPWSPTAFTADKGGYYAITDDAATGRNRRRSSPTG